MAWLIGFLVAVAVLALGFALVDAVLAIVARARALGLTRSGRFRLALRAYRPQSTAAESLLPPAWSATLSVLRRPSPFIVGLALGSLALAGLARDVVLSPYLLLLDLGIVSYLAYRQTLRVRQHTGDQVRRLVDAFVGLYRVNPTTFATLALAGGHLPPGALRAAVQAAVHHYETTRDTHEALQKLLAVPDPYLARFVLVLDQAGEQGPTEIVNLLADLQVRLRRRWTTRLAAQGVFAALRGTLAVLIGAAVVVTVVGVTVPLWREIHLGSPVSRIVFIALTTVAFTAAAFFDRRMRLDEETLL